MPNLECQVGEFILAQEAHVLDPRGRCSILYTRSSKLREAKLLKELTTSRLMVSTEDPYSPEWNTNNSAIQNRDSVAPSSPATVGDCHCWWSVCCVRCCAERCVWMERSLLVLPLYALRCSHTHLLLNLLPLSAQLCSTCKWIG